MRHISFDREKFRELVLYVAGQTADDRWFGDTHLNKVLYWTDFSAYQGLGHPVTGARYFKLKFGPAARPLLPVRDELRQEGLLEVQEPPAGSTGARKTISHRDADTSVFSPEELELVDRVIEQLKGKTAGRISGISHEEPGWQLVDMEDDIPYEMALISKEAPSEHALARARARAEQLGW